LPDGIGTLTAIHFAIIAVSVPMPSGNRLRPEAEVEEVSFIPIP
jgi:hypothetical protein